MKAGWLAKSITSVTVVLLVLPIVVIIPMSFSAGTGFHFPPEEWSLRWYESFFSSPRWQRALMNSLIIGFATAFVVTVIGTMAALAVARMTPRLRSVATSLVLIPVVIPNILIALAIYSTFLMLKLNGTLHGIAIAHIAISLPFVFIAVTARLQGIDMGLRSAAISLGATPWAAFRQVILPLLLPGVVSGAILAFVTSFDEVVIALFLQTPANTTLPVQMFNSVAIEIDPTISAASSFVVVSVSIIVFVGQSIGLSRRKSGERK